VSIDTLKGANELETREENKERVIEAGMSTPTEV
jgi:hypothetical protein